MEEIQYPDWDEVCRRVNIYRDGGFTGSLFKRSCDYPKPNEESLLREVLGDNAYALTLNRYPYDLGEGIVHHVLWMHPDCFRHMPLDYEIERMITSLLSDDEFVWFENPRSIKSVHTIPHVQVFSRATK